MEQFQRTIEAIEKTQIRHPLNSTLQLGMFLVLVGYVDCLLEELHH